MGAAAGHVALLATGGTISAGPDGSLGAAALIRLAASGTEGIPADIPVRGVDVAAAPGSRVTPASIAALAAAVRASLADEGCRGVVVTHGTDTVEEVAFACDLLVGQTTKPVVFTGAMVPPRTRGTDAHTNLARAIRIAGHLPTPVRGAVIVMGHGIHAAVDARKLSTQGVDAFASPGAGPIGWIGPDTIDIVQENLRVAVRTHRLEPAVELVRLTAGGGDRLLRAAAAGARGLVVELFGAGNAPEAVAETIRDSVSAGTIVLVCSRVGLGGLAPESGVLETGAIPAVLQAGGAAPVTLDGLKARILLMAALGAGLDTGGIRSLFVPRPPPAPPRDG